MGGCHPHFEIPLNPWNPGVWSGASSSGSGVATAADCPMGPWEATQAVHPLPGRRLWGGGLKANLGQSQRYGVLALAESLDHVGPLTRSTADAAVIAPGHCRS